ncbi:MAG: hypothetical protein DI537_14435 [Stutzerimonas stutzeri]|nr:MAG: hypothetical protein DI537_14435 [Stutzerimonas stutzeri]
MSIFEQASRKKFRFPSSKGELTTEQLWDLPLISKNPFNLDGVAQTIAFDLDAVTTRSFVQTKPDPRKADLTAKLEVVKHIIGVKLKEQEEAANKAATAEKRRKLVEALAAKDEEAITKLSREDILKQLAELEGN